MCSGEFNNKYVMICKYLVCLNIGAVCLIIQNNRIVAQSYSIVIVLNKRSKLRIIF